jgi:signal transduction histidine kinase
MTRTTDRLSEADGVSDGAEDHAAPPPPPPPPRGEGTLVFPARTRAAGVAGMAVVGVLAVALSTQVTDDRNGYVLVYGLSAAPYLVGAMAGAHRARQECPPQVRAFWQSSFTACLLATLACVAAVTGVVLDSPALLVLDVVLLLAATPFWTATVVHMVKVQAGRRDPSVDHIDGVMAVVVLSAPGVLLVVEPLLETTDVLFAAPLALFMTLMPACLYSAVLNLTRAPRHERVTLGLGVALAAAFSVSVTLQLTRSLGGIDLPLPVFVGFHVLTLALVMAVPLWAHRVIAGGLGRLPVERQVRGSNPMPTISAVVLPPLALYVLVWRGDQPWAVAHLAAVLVAVVVLNAVRHALLSREARRLSGELAQMAEERGQLLAAMVRALDDDRRRTVSELHTQAVGSLSTLGTIAQTACVSLPTSTAQVVRETIARVQTDLSDRAEELRRLMVAMRPPGADIAGGRLDDVLSAALRAYASELGAPAPGAARPVVRVAVDPTLELDRSTLTIAYRIAQEALLNAVRHAHARAVEVTVGVAESPAGVIVEVADDGIGFDPQAVRDGAGLASMQLFTDLGRGELTVRSAPGGGTVVCSRLGVGAGQARSRRHLRLLPAPGGNGSTAPG